MNDQTTELIDSMNQSFIEHQDSKIKDVEPLPQYYESTSSLDLTQDDEEGSKIDASVSATDSGLIGNLFFCTIFKNYCIFLFNG